MANQLPPLKTQPRLIDLFKEKLKRATRVANICTRVKYLTLTWFRRGRAGWRNAVRALHLRTRVKYLKRNLYREVRDEWYKIVRALHLRTRVKYLRRNLYREVRDEWYKIVRALHLRTRVKYLIRTVFKITGESLRNIEIALNEPRVQSQIRWSIFILAAGLIVIVIFVISMPSLELTLRQELLTRAGCTGVPLGIIFIYIYNILKRRAFLRSRKQLAGVIKQILSPGHLLPMQTFDVEITTHVSSFIHEGSDPVTMANARLLAQARDVVMIVYRQSQGPPSRHRPHSPTDIEQQTFGALSMISNALNADDLVGGLENIGSLFLLSREYQYPKGEVLDPAAHYTFEQLCFDISNLLSVNNTEGARIRSQTLIYSLLSQENRNDHRSKWHFLIAYWIYIRFIYLGLDLRLREDLPLRRQNWETKWFSSKFWVTGPRLLGWQIILAMESYENEDWHALAEVIWDSFQLPKGVPAPLLNRY